MNLDQQQERFSRRLDSLRRTLRWRTLWIGLLRWAAIGLPAGWAAIWALGGESEPATAARLGLNLSLTAGLLVLGMRWVAVPWWRMRHRHALVRWLERRGRHANLLVSAEEALRLPDRWQGLTPISRELKRRLLSRAVQELEGIRPAKVKPFRYARWVLPLLLISATTASIWGTREASELERGLRRLAVPLPSPQIAAVGGFYPNTPPHLVVAGEDHTVEALDFGGGSEPTYCEVRIGSGTWQRIAPRMEWLSSGDVGLPPPGRTWFGTLENVQEDFVWRFRRGARMTPEQQVSVHRHPLLTRMGAVIRPPLYTGLPAQSLNRLPAWIEVPQGSSVELSGELNHTVETATLVPAEAAPRPLAVDCTRVQGGWTVVRDEAFHLALLDRFGLRNESPVAYTIEVAPDEVPVVHLERPDDDGILPLEGDLGLRVEAVDDFGLLGLDLQVRAISATGSRVRGMREDSDSGWSGGAFWRPDSGDGPVDWRPIATDVGILSLRSTPVDASQPGGALRLELSTRLDALELVPGDALELRIEARDNRQPGPPGIGHSRILRLSLPSAAEVLAEQAESAEDQRSDLEEMRRRQRQLSVDLDRLSRELLKNPIPDWARQQEMEAALRRQKALQEELSRVADEVRGELDRLAESQLTSGEMMDHADEISSLLDPTLSDPLRDLLEKMEQSGGEMSPQEVARAIQEVAKDQKEMARRLDAAVAMMERMSREQNLEGMTALLEKMMRKQQELAEASRQQAQQDAESKSEPESGAESGEQKGESAEAPSGEKQSGQPSPDDPGEQADAGGDPESHSAAGEEPDPEELARRQEALARELDELRDQLQQALDELARKSESQPGESGSSDAGEQQYEQALQEAMKNLEEQLAKQSMKKAAEQIEGMDPEMAAQMQQQALRDLGSLYHVLMQSQEAMQMAMQTQQLTALHGLAADLLTLSARQESIAARIPLRMREVRSKDLTRGEYRLQKAAAQVRDQLSELMDDSPRQIMALLEKLDTLIEEMGRSVQAMNENRGSQARRYATSSLGQANSLVIHLLTQAQMSGGGQGSSGNPQPSFSEQLQKLAREQSGLNGLTEQIRQMLANRGISQEMRSQMSRLGEKQGELAGQLQELERQERLQPEGERILGDLGALGREMERVSREIDDGLVSEQTLIRQERILGHLLDARNSVRRRDYTQRREGRTADELHARQEGRAGSGQDDATRRVLRFQPLNKAPLEYRDLVRRYFSAVDSLLQSGPRATGGELP